MALATSLAVALLLVLTAPLHGHFTHDRPGAVQKFHDDPTPRVGGLAIFVGLLAAWFAVASRAVLDILQVLLLAGLPALVFGLLEDVTKRVGVLPRLMATMFSGALASMLTGVALTINAMGIDKALSWRDLILIGGGMVLMFKSVKELHHVSAGPQRDLRPKKVTVAGVIAQIMFMDLVFSLDSVITAVGMSDHLPTMVAAVVASVAVMMFAAEPISNFVENRRSVKVLALSFPTPGFANPSTCFWRVVLEWRYLEVPGGRVLTPSSVLAEVPANGSRPCSSTPPTNAARVVVPENFTGLEASATVYLQSIPKECPTLLESGFDPSCNSGSNYKYARRAQAMTLAQPRGPLADLVALAEPVSVQDGTILDARGSTDIYGQPMSYSWDLDGDGVFGDAPGTTVPGTARLIPLRRAGRLTEAEKEQSLTGVARMSACRPTDGSFVSLEAAPEVVGPVPVSAGLLRLWDMKVAWRDVNPSDGVFDFSVLDERVAQAEASGARPLLVLGLTPQWAAANPAAGDPRWGAGSASPPRDIELWNRYVSAVSSRYGGRIAAYEIWNEANLQTFWAGDASTLAQMTRSAYDIIKASSPGSVVLTPSVTTRLRSPMEKFQRAYLAALTPLGLPFDGFAIHTYPAGNAGPDQRYDDVRYWQQVVSTALGPASPALDRPVWDTEVNYGLAGPGATPGATYADPEGAVLLTRTLQDSQRLGIDAVFWYMFTASPFSLLGVQFTSSTPAMITAWNEARAKYGSGGGSCTGTISASVQVTNASGQSTIATRQFDLADMPVIASASLGQRVGTSSLAEIPVTVSLPRSPDPNQRVTLACVEDPDYYGHYIDKVRFSRPVLVDPGANSVSFTIAAPDTTRDRYATSKVRVALWSGGNSVADGRCSNNTGRGSGLMQVATALIDSQGAGLPRAKAPRAYVANSRLTVGAPTVVRQGTLSADGTVRGNVVRGSFRLATPAKGSGVARPRTLGLLAGGSYVLQMGDYRVDLTDIGADGTPREKAFVGDGLMLLRGARGALACARVDATPEEIRLTSVATAGPAAGLSFRSVDEPFAFTLSGKPVNHTPKGGSGQILARTVKKQPLPAMCKPLLRYLR